MRLDLRHDLASGLADSAVEIGKENETPEIIPKSAYPLGAVNSL